MVFCADDANPRVSVQPQATKRGVGRQAAFSHLGRRSSACFGIAVPTPREDECAVVKPDVVENLFYACSVGA